MKETRSPCHLLSKYQCSLLEEHLCGERQHPAWEAPPAPPGASHHHWTPSAPSLGSMWVLTPGMFPWDGIEEPSGTGGTLPVEPQVARRFVLKFVGCHFVKEPARFVPFPRQLPGSGQLPGEGHLWVFGTHHCRSSNKPHLFHQKCLLNLMCHSFMYIKSSTKITLTPIYLC